MREEMTDLGIHEVEYDRDNPRIKGALEKYGDEITAERIHFALRSSSDGTSGSGSESFHNLKVSIKANHGIAERIKVVAREGNYTCIDGNTRLAIYREFAKNEENKNWLKIPCIVLNDASDLDVEKIRVTAHLLGARPWPAYEKAKYLNYLRYQEYMDYGELIALCGGSKSDIERQIDAFDDMNKYYRDRVEDSDFRIDRFSGFVELQKQGVREAIFQSGFELSDFGDWIHNGNIKNLADVRKLPKVLRDDEAKLVLAQGGVNAIKEAERIADKNSRTDTDDASLDFMDADVVVLAHALYKKLSDLPVIDLGKLKDSEAIETLEDLSDRLTEILDYVRE